MRSRDLIDGFDYGEYMQRQMFCFGSSDDGVGAGGGQPDRSNPNEMRAREQNFVDTRYGGDSDSFMNDVAAGAYSALAAEEQAAAEAQARASLGNIGSDRGVDAAAVNAALNNIAAAVEPALKNAQLGRVGVTTMSPLDSQVKYGTTDFAGLYDNLSNFKAPTTEFTPAELAAGERARAAIDAHNAAVMSGQRPGEGTTAYTPEFTTDVVNQMQKAEEERLAQQVAQSYIDNASIMGPELYSPEIVGGSLLDFFKTGSTGGVPLRSNYFADPTTLNAFKDIALGQIPGRMEKAGSLPGFMGTMGKFTLSRMQKALEAGGRPVFDKQGRLAGVFSEGLLGGEVYTGMPVEGVPGTGYDSGDDRGGEPPVVPVEEETGQCPEGYIFDEDLQACRMDTSSGATFPVTTPPTFAPGAYARMGLLDVAPGMSPGKSMAMYGNLSGAGKFDFDAANRAFRMATATRPEYYSDPYDLTGYTLLA